MHPAVSVCKSNTVKAAGVRFLIGTSVWVVSINVCIDGFIIYLFTSTKTPQPIIEISAILKCTHYNGNLIIFLMYTVLITFVNIYIKLTGNKIVVLCMYTDLHNNTNYNIKHIKILFVLVDLCVRVFVCECVCVRLRVG